MKENKKTRSIQITLDKAREWYKRGGELKELALKAYSEEELSSYSPPKTWVEFISRNQGNKMYYIGGNHCILEGTYPKANYSSLEQSKNSLPTRELAEKTVAFMQLLSLHYAWVGNWKPNKKEIDVVYIICHDNTSIYVNAIRTDWVGSNFFRFPTKEMANEFIDCFKDLFELHYNLKLRHDEL